MIFGQTNVPVELAFTAARSYRDISNELEVDVVFQAPWRRRIEGPRLLGRRQRVPRALCLHRAGAAYLSV